MNWIDAILTAVMVYFLFTGWRAGIIQTFFRYLSIVVGLILAVSYQNVAADLLVKSGIPLKGTWLETLAFVVLFLVAVGMI